MIDSDVGCGGGAGGVGLAGPLGGVRAQLGEGPVWHDGRLLWVDIEGGQVLQCGADGGIERVVDVGERVGFAWPCEVSGRVICGTQSGLAFLDLEGGGREAFAGPEAGCERTRFNDGKCDPSGRLWAGTMDLEEREPLGSLYLVDESLRPQVRWSGITVANGLAWDPDGVTFYYIDSPTREVWAFDYDAGSGVLSNQRVAVSIPEGEGFPDGMTIDAEGKLWIALWQGWGVVRYDPRTGERLGKIEVPVAKVTSCCFGGDRQEDLFITTARVGLGEEELAAQPGAGGLFRARPGVTGVRATPFRG